VEGSSGEERLARVVEELHAANSYAYGYRRMWKALLRAGEICSVTASGG
jgi:hypothetical protein